jgi:peptidoglycan/xylan/chitin deacetylase (PgdA/CDA1 family)
LRCIADPTRLLAVTVLAALAGVAAGSGGAAPAATSVTPSHAAVPILMYHVLGDPPSGEPYPGLFVHPAAFAGQVRWLEKHGYRAVTLDTVWRAWHGRASLPKHPIVLTFDDGYRSDVGVALPVLKQVRWPGVLNLALKNLSPRGLRPSGVRRLLGAAWEVDAHSLTHPDLTTVSAAQLVHEVAGSRAEIRHLFHVPVDFFCYPAGRYDASVIAEVRRAGFLGATTTNNGLARPADLYTLDRIRVDRGDDVSGLAVKLHSLGA